MRAADAGRYAASPSANSKEKKMKAMFLLATIIIFVVSGSVLGQSKMPKSDQTLIEQVIENWNKAWQTKDAK